MEHTNLFLFENESDLETVYPGGNVNDPIPGVAYARGEDEDDFVVYYNRMVTTYQITIHSKDKSGTTVAADYTINTPDVLDGNPVRMNIVAPDVADYKAKYPTQKVEFTSANTEHTIIYLAATSYTVTVNHLYSGTPIASATTIEVTDIFEEDVVTVKIEPEDIPGYTAETVYINVSSDTIYNLEYQESTCYVDLGLPSGTLWACMNVGADSPEEVGNIYAWGEIETKSYYDISNYKFYSGIHFRECSSDYTKYNVCDELGNLELADDVANVELGGDWHIPTKEQWYELLDNTTLDYESIRGCVVLTSNINGNSIILPIYTYNTSPEATESNCVSWTNSLDLYGNYNQDSNAFLSHMGCENYLGPESVSRYFGAPVRPVLGAGPEPFNPID